MPHTLEIRWSKETFTVPIESKSVYDVRQFIEESTQVPIDRQKYSPAVLKMNELNKPILDIAYFQKAKSDVVKLLMVGSVPQKVEAILESKEQATKQSQKQEQNQKSTKKSTASEDLNSSTESASVSNRQTHQASPSPASVSSPVQQKALAGLNRAEAAISSIQSEVDKNFTSKRKKPNAEAKKKLRLQWTEQLTQTQLKLDAIELPSVPDVTEEERVAMRQSRKDLIVRAEKLIALVAQYCGNS